MHALLKKQTRSNTTPVHRRIFEFAKSYDLKSRPHAMLWLSKVYGIPAGMYASQVWGTEYLSEGSHLTW